MARSLANVDITSDSFLTWVSQTNKLLDALTNEVMTVSTTAAGGNSTLANTTGNAQLIGSFGANTVAVTTALRGGNVSTAGVLTISSNVALTGTQLQIGSTLVANDNSIIIGSNAVVNTSSVKIGNSTVNSVLTSSILTIANSSASANVTPAGISAGSSVVNSTHISANSLILNTDYEIQVVSNTDIGSNTTAAQTIFSFPHATYSSGKFIVQIQNTGNTQISEMLIAHDGTSAYITVYGTVISPLASDLGDYSVAVNGANVDLRVLQSAINSSTKVVAHLIK